ncbi:MAG: hypothetical protein V1729_01025 [Candidatus Woesearchaeota archaeon]
MSFFVRDVNESSNNSINLERELQRIDRADGILANIEPSMFESDEGEFLAIPKYRTPSAAYIQDNTESERQYFD